jgi:hypothetical protein
MTMEQTHLYEETLREVNMVRSDWGLEPLGDILPGVPCVDDKCAIAASIVCNPERPRPNFMYTTQEDGRHLRAKMQGWLTVRQMTPMPPAIPQISGRNYQDCDIPNIQLFAQAFDRGEVDDKYYLPGTKSLCKPKDAA